MWSSRSAPRKASWPRACDSDSRREPSSSCVPTMPRSSSCSFASTSPSDRAWSCSRCHPSTLPKCPPRATSSCFDPRARRRRKTMGKKVIIIDDSRTVRDQVRLVLEPAGYEVLEAGDGNEGINQFRDHLDLAMAICDVNMPGMTGIGMLESLKASGLGRGLPIVMLTTEGQPALIQKAKQAGARGWIVKPFKPEQLLATVQKLAGTA